MAPTQSIAQRSTSRFIRLVVFVLGVLMTLPSVATAQHFPPFDPYYPSWSSVSVLPDARDPHRVEARARFRWGDPSEEASRISVGFPANAALEIELHFRRRGYLMPRGGRDWQSDPDAVGVSHNLPGHVYVDVWNYSVPNTSAIGRSQAARSVFSQCFGLEAILTGSLEHLTGSWLPPAYRDAVAWTDAALVFTGRVPEDPDGNFTVGVLDASQLIRGMEYEVYYPLFVADAAVYSTTAREPDNRNALESDFSQFALRFQRIRNTCTFAPVLRLPVATTHCPFFIGGGVGICDEANDQAPDDQDTGTIMGRLCAPTGEWSAHPATDSAVRGVGFMRDPEVCFDNDGDGYFATTSGPSPAYGTRVSDCDDRERLISPGAAETVCDDRLDNDCDHQPDCLDPDCRSQCPFVCTSAAQCDDGNACNGSEVCAAGRCQHSLPSACARGEVCDPALGCVNCPPGAAPRPCYAGASGTAGVGRCRMGTQRCGGDGHWQACVGQMLPALDETCGNGLDDDCNGTVDDGCTVCTDGRTVLCYTGAAATRGVGVCAAGTQPCAVGRWGTCQGEIVPQRENCLDGFDNDCDGRADCLDSDCRGQSYCARLLCGDGRCDTAMGEACGSCPTDCCPSMSGDAGIDTPVPDVTPGETCIGSVTQVCGNCGTQSRSCTGGRWGSWGPCTSEGVCRPAATQACGSGGTQTCSAICGWGSCTGQTCSGTATQPCGNCGMQTRVCTAGTWSAWLLCDGEGSCTPGRTRSCADSGAIVTCTSACAWPTCPACGALGQNCCVGSVCSVPSATCLGGSCQHCGGRGEPCCAAGSCTPGMACDTSTRTCQPPTLMCSCTDGDRDGYYSTSCTDATCAPRTDCDDTPRGCLAWTGAPERFDFVDNDCDGRHDDQHLVHLDRYFFDAGGGNLEHRFATAPPGPSWNPDGSWIELIPLDVCTNPLYRPEDARGNTLCTGPNTDGVVGVQAPCWSSSYAFVELVECRNAVASWTIYVTSDSAEYRAHRTDPAWTCRPQGYVVTSASAAADGHYIQVYRHDCGAWTTSFWDTTATGGGGPCTVAASWYVPRAH